MRQTNVQKNDKKSDWQIGCYTSLKLHLHVIKAKKIPHTWNISCTPSPFCADVSKYWKPLLSAHSLPSDSSTWRLLSVYKHNGRHITILQSIRVGFSLQIRSTQSSCSLNFPKKPNQARLKSVYTTASQPLVDYSLIISTYTRPTGPLLNCR